MSLLEERIIRSRFERNVGMRKGCILKSVCCVFFVYFTVIAFLSILHLGSKREESQYPVELISFTEISDHNVTASQKDDWRCVSDNVHVYSAFWEYRTKPTMVRIIGMGERMQTYASKLICLLKYPNYTIMVTTANCSNLEDNHDMFLSIKYFYCKTDVKPASVALVSTGSKCISWLKVHDTTPAINAPRNSIALCTQPLYSNRAKSLTTLNVAEFIAFYEILGVSKFVFYDYRANGEVKALLKRLSAAGLSIQLLPWTYPKDAFYIWNVGQIGSVADCVYKHASDYEYVAVFDLDEYVVPAANVTLQELLGKMMKTNGSNWSSFMFRHSFFCLDYPDDPLAKNVTLPLVTQTKTERGKIWDPYARAKSIVRPRAVVMPGIHYTWEPLPGFNASLDINPSFALLHHYRRDLCKYDKKGHAVDRTTWRYQRQLMESRALRVWKEVTVSNGK